MRKVGLLSVFVIVSLLLGVTSIATAQSSRILLQVEHSLANLDDTSIAEVKYENPVLGVRLVYTNNFEISEPQYLFPEYGFMLSDAAKQLVLSVDWLYQSSPDQLPALVKQVRESFPGMPIEQSNIQVAGYPAIALSNVPGIVPNTWIYVVANKRLYRMIYGHEKLDAQGEVLLKNMGFVPPTKSLESLALLKAEDALDPTPPLNVNIPVPLPRPQVLNFQNTMLAQGQPSMPLIATGCVSYPYDRLLYIPWSASANGPGTNWASGWSQAGPSYYGEGLHVGCNRAGYLNDYYALDFPLKDWDYIWAPAAGTVMYAGWAGGGESTLGRIVVIELINQNGQKYWSMSAHLHAINVSVGQQVNYTTIVGRAGGSGNGIDGYWSPHLHQGLYLNAALHPSGGVISGQSARPDRTHHFGNGEGDYYGFSQYQQLSY